MADTEWLPFEGTAEKVGDRYRLTGDGGGIVELAEGDVRENGGEIEVRLLADTALVEAPAAVASNPMRDERVMATAGRCPTPRKACIGLVLFCCRPFKPVGVCLGVSGC